MTAELISLCQRIMEDRALTDEEVQQLHDWLHAHPESWKEWPASVLIEPVHAVLEDGGINEKELYRVANCLVAIESEWSAKMARQIIHQAVQAFDTSVPELPALQLNVPVRSPSEEWTFEVDLASHQCSCSDWSGQRDSHPVGHIGRCCKHVARAFLTAVPQKGWPDWLQALFVDCDWRGRGTCPEDQWSIVAIRSRPILVSSGKRGWSNVFAPAKSGRYERFGYSWSERRWSYGILPPEAPTIATALHQCFELW